MRHVPPFLHGFDIQASTGGCKVGITEVCDDDTREVDSGDDDVGERYDGDSRGKVCNKVKGNIKTDGDGKDDHVCVCNDDEDGEANCGGDFDDAEEGNMEGDVDEKDDFNNGDDDGDGDGDREGKEDNEDEGGITGVVLQGIPPVSVGHAH